MSTAASTTRTVAEAHARLRTHSEIQFDLPGAQPTGTGPPAWLVELLRALGPVAQVIFWGVVIAAVLLILWLAARWVMARSQRDAAPDRGDAMAEWRPEKAAARALLAEAEALAEAGRYDEAARLLLHRSLEDIARRRPRLLKPSLTSREIARAPLLPGGVRGAFDAMAAPVERSLFGGRRLARTDWEEARDAYRAFALPEAWA